MARGRAARRRARKPRYNALRKRVDDKARKPPKKESNDEKPASPRPDKTDKKKPAAPSEQKKAARLARQKCEPPPQKKKKKVPQKLSKEDIAAVEAKIQEAEVAGQLLARRVEASEKSRENDVPWTC